MDIFTTELPTSSYCGDGSSGNPMAIAHSYCYKLLVECVSCSQLPFNLHNCSEHNSNACICTNLSPQTSNSCLVSALRKQSKPNSISDYSSHIISKARAVHQLNNNIRAGFASQINPLGRQGNLEHGVTWNEPSLDQNRHC